MCYTVSYLGMALGLISMVLAIVGFFVRKKMKSTTVATIMLLSIISCSGLPICVLGAISLDLFSGGLGFTLDTIQGWITVVAGVAALTIVLNAVSVFTIAKRS